ncbi:MAG TPA: hypothetical protein VIV60_20605, partial [Polyangiaceae bacterium]
MQRRWIGLLSVLTLGGCEDDRRLGGETGQAGIPNSAAGQTTSTLVGGNRGMAGTSHLPNASGGINIGGAGVSTGGSTVLDTTTLGGTAGGFGEFGGSASGGTTTVNGTGGTTTVNSAAGSVASMAGAGVSTGGITAMGGTAGSNASMAAAGFSSGGTAMGGAAGSAGAAAGATGRCFDACGLYGPACCIATERCLAPGNSCTIDVLSTTVSTTYDYASLEAKVAAAPQGLGLTLTDLDFASVEMDPAPAARMALHLTSDASAKYTAAFAQLRESHPFRLSCNGRSLFVGVTYIWYGQAALQTPVFDAISDSLDQMTLYLGAIEGAWLFPSNQVATAARERIDRPELRAAFCQRGALRVLDADA